MWVPLKKKTNNKRKLADGERTETSVERVWRGERIIFFSLLVSFSDLRKSNPQISSGPKRKVLYATRATRVYKKQGISLRIMVKIRKNPYFGFSQIYDILTVIIFETRVNVTLHDESYAWVPKSRDFVEFSREIVNTYKIVSTYAYV